MACRLLYEYLTCDGGCVAEDTPSWWCALFCDVQKLCSVVAFCGTWLLSMRSCEMYGSRVCQVLMRNCNKRICNFRGEIGYAVNVQPLSLEFIILRSAVQNLAKKLLFFVKEAEFMIAI
jgi:hypothetical protein